MNTPPPKRIGRPRKIELNEQTLRLVKECAAHMCTVREAAAFLGVSHGTFETFLGTYKKARETWDAGKELGRVSIRRLQFLHAKKNAGMAIWLGKVILGQTEVTQTQMGGIPGAPPVGLEHSAGRGISALVAAARLEHEKKEAAKLIAGPPQDPATLPPPEREPILKPQEAPTAPESSAATIPAGTFETPPHEAPGSTAAPPAPPPEPPPPPPPPPKAAPAIPHGAPAGFATHMAARIQTQDFIESGGMARPISDEDVLREARRLGLNGQVSAHEMNELRKKLAGEPYQPTYAEMCERSGAVMSRRPLFRR